MPHRFLTCCSQREIQNEISECKIEVGAFKINNNNNNNLYLSVKAKIAVTEPLNGDTISEIYIYININVNIKVLKKKKQTNLF